MSSASDIKRRILADIGTASFPGSDRMAGTLAEEIANAGMPVLSVKDFGAIGDGIADDRPAFLAARNSIAAGKAGTIFVPRGAYYLSSSLAGQSGNFVQWLFDSGAYVTNAPGGSESWGRLTGAQFRREYRTSNTPRIEVTTVADPLQGNAIGRYESVENVGPGTAYGYRVSYKSAGYGEGTFDIAEGVLCSWTRVPGEGRAGQQLTQWRVAATPELPLHDNNTYGTFIAEWNVANRGPDAGFIKKRAGTGQWCGFLQIVPEQQFLSAPTANYGFGNVQYGIVFTWAHGDNGGRGFVPRIMAHLLHEPNSVHDAGYAVYASGSDGSDTMPGGGASQAYLGLDQQWKWGIKTNEATFTQQAIALGSGQRIGWLDASNVLQGAVSLDAAGAWGIGTGYATRGVRGVALAFGRALADGDRQVRTLHLRRNSGANPSALRLTTDGQTAGSGNQLVLANTSAVRVVANVVARSNTPAAAGWTVTALLRRGGSASAMTLVSSSVTKDTSDDLAADWTINVVADTTIGGLGFELSGTGTIAAFAHVDVVELVS